MVTTNLCRKSGDHSKEDLDKFNRQPYMKYKYLIMLLNFDTTWKTKYKNYGIFFIKKFPSLSSFISGY